MNPGLALYTFGKDDQNIRNLPPHDFIEYKHAQLYVLNCVEENYNFVIREGSVLKHFLLDLSSGVISLGSLSGTIGKPFLLFLRIKIMYL
jgi:hypothetical protein